MKGSYETTATLNIETEDVYEASLLAETGDFADLTQGEGVETSAGTREYFGDF